MNHPNRNQTLPAPTFHSVVRGPIGETVRAELLDLVPKAGRGMRVQTLFAAACDSMELFLALEHTLRCAALQAGLSDSEALATLAAARREVREREQ